jgi:L-tyrosine isonitrile synthase
LRNKSLQKTNNTSIVASKITTKKVLETFNTWAFKREQPTELTLLQGAVSEAIASDSPIPFVLYWGKGPRRCISTAEKDCLAFLQQMTARIETAYPIGAAVKLILTDTHAGLNGHDAVATAEYFAEVQDAADGCGFTACHLSSIVAEFGDHTLDALAQPNSETLDRLQKCAAKWYRGENGVAEAAGQYYAMNMREKQAVGRGFPSTIFISFNGSEYRELFPDALPVFYMYSMRKGISVKPWFADDNARSGSTGNNPGLRRIEIIGLNDAASS